MPKEPLQNSIDIPFSVPFVHRLRVTDDIAGEDFAELLGVLDRGDAGPAKVLVVSESALATCTGKIGDRLRACDSIQLVRDPLLIDGGEETKNSTAVVKQLLNEINDANLDRRSYIVAIGGGAMLDVVGYAAAIAHRGIRLIRLPTTTLAQADSGVGVKNAINYFDKKNWVGAFAVPWAVINDTGLLQSLSDRDFRSGFSEAVKVSLLKDPDEFNWLFDHADEIRRREESACKQAIHRSCMLHLRHITSGGDPFEMLEARPLDFGHWSAHRLEPLSNFQIRHGEAVAIGVAIDSIYSTMKYGFAESDMLRVCQCLTTLGLPLWHDSVFPVDRLMQGLEEFRQHLGGRLTITMLQRVGEPINVHEVDEDIMKASIQTLYDLQSHLLPCGNPGEPCGQPNYEPTDTSQA